LKVSFYRGCMQHVCYGIYAKWERARRRIYLHRLSLRGKQSRPKIIFIDKPELSLEGLRRLCIPSVRYHSKQSPMAELYA